MATLEKIRSKSVFLIVIIGLALLAFIVGDALTNSRNIFGDHTLVAKIGSTKIDITEYQRKREELNNQLEEARRQNPAQVANFDPQTLPQIAIQSLMQENLVLNAADKAGINVTGNLLQSYMLDNMQNQDVMRIVGQLNAAGLSVQTARQAYEFIFNPTRNGLTDAQMEPYQRIWLAAEASAKDDIARQIYYRILQNSVKANELDKKALYNDYINTSIVEYAFLPYGELSEKEYPVTDAELKKLYDEEKGDYRVNEATKDMQFIAVNISPSDKDKAASKALAELTVKVLGDSGAQLSKELKKDGVQLTHHGLRAADLQNGELKEFVMNGPKDSVKLISENFRGFTVVRVTGRSSEIDSICVNTVVTSTEDLGRKVLASLNAGLPADSLTVRYSTDSVMPQLNQWIPLYNAQGRVADIPKETIDSIVKGGGKYVTLQSGPQGMMMASLVERKAPVTIYDYDEATYVLGPSTETVNDERTKLEKFIAQNGKAEDFIKNAEKAGYMLQQYSVTQSTPAVPRMMGMNSYFPDSRQVIRWVMIDAKDGEVSHIYESKSATNPAFYAACVTASYDDYIPLQNATVKEVLTSKIRSQKAGQKFEEKYGKNTKSIEEAAKAMGVEPRTAETFRFGPSYGINDASVMGAISGTKADKKVIYIKGDNGLYVYQVKSQKKDSFPYNEQTYQQQYMQLINPNLMDMIQGKDRIKNNVYKFEAGD